jgi:sodium/proline symporter
MTANLPIIVTFLCYLLAVLTIGLLGYRVTSNLSDYILGGRRLGSLVTALAAGASDMSGWLLMGLPGAVFLAGFSGSWIAIGLIIGAYLNWRFIAARLRLYTEKFGNSLTIPEFLTNRFEDKHNTLRIVAALAILIFFTLYCAAGIVAGANLFESIFNISYTQAMWIGALASISYVFIGGFLAVSWTDTIQAALMIVALLLTPLIIIQATGGYSHSVDIIAAEDISNLSLLKGLNAVGIISLLAWGLGYFGQPHILVRFMASESAKNIPNARRISMTWMILCLLGAVSVGFFGIAYFTAHPENALEVNQNAERVFIESAKHLFNPWITGFLLAAILSAIMNTLSCQLLMCSSALTEDIYKTFFRKKASQRELVWCSRFMVLAIAAIAILIASNPKSGILHMVGYAWAGFGAAFGPVIILSLLWSRTTKNGALAGIIIGTITVLVWNHNHWFDLYEIVPGFVFATIGVILVSLLDKKPDASIDNKFKVAAKELKRELG